MPAPRTHRSPPKTQDSALSTHHSAPTTQHSAPSTPDSSLSTQHSALVPHHSSLIIKTAEFETSAVKAAQYPASLLPEIAFAGRSNVGKSSLINCLAQRKKLVRTSRTPGLTRLINFFRINEAFYFVDLPGYGFARVPESVRAQWRPMVEGYLLERKTLRGIVHIIDARHLPTPDDIQLWVWLHDRRIPVIPVLTKADKVPQSKRHSQVKAAAQSLGASPGGMVLFSSVTGQGRDVLLARIQALILP